MDAGAFDSDLLQTFVAVVDCGGFAKAGLRRHLTQSTVSQQMQRLEDRVGLPLFAPAGRKRVLTESGETLLRHARKILTMHDAAAAALRDGEGGGVARIGVPQDFAEARLPALLRGLHRSHPGVRVEVRVGMSRQLRSLVDDALLDVAVVLHDPRGRPGVLLAHKRAGWLAARDFAPPARGEPWPLALFDPPCIMRETALRALDAERIPWRIAYSSPSLAGIFAAVHAGLAVTARLADDAGRGLRLIDRRAGLPTLGSFRYELVFGADPLSPAAKALVSVLRSDLIASRRRRHDDGLFRGFFPSCAAPRESPTSSRRRS
jgi:DNA-binding transcriptional LysR family regulator